MVVYVEYAFLENFLVDFALLYLALLVARCKIGKIRLICAACVGACEAIVFPLFSLPVALAYLVKLVGGVILVLIAVSGGRAKTYAVASLAFFFFTFAFGGLLTAAYSFFDAPYVEGNGYLIEGAPVGLILGGVGVFFIVCAWLVKAGYKFVKLQQKTVDCTLVHGGRQVKWKGLIDSGNLLSYHGAPVSVLSPVAALALFSGEKAFVGSVWVTTVHGTKRLRLLKCERVTIGKRVIEGAYFALSDVKLKGYQMILHTAWLEGEWDYSAT